MTSDAILVELRSLPGAPDSLRERVRALPEPRPRFVWTLPRIDLRRTLLVAAPAVLALGVGAAALHGVLAGDAKRTPQPLALDSGMQHGAKVTVGARNVPALPTFSPDAAKQDQTFSQPLRST